MKEVRDFYDQFDTCREHDIPLCADACPFRLDILDIQERITKKRFNAAYKTIRDCTIFPAIVARVCPAYCQEKCIRKLTDDPIQIRKLEQAVIALAPRKDPNAYNLPVRDVKVGVIGGGISGMAFALKMASRKCSVTVFEKEAQIGGKLKEVMDEAEYLEEIAFQFKQEKYELHLNTEARFDINTGKVTAAGQDWDFDVVYIATGSGGEEFGVTEGAVKVTRPDGARTGAFTGGMLNGKDLMHALADGVNIAVSADAFAKTGNIELPTEPAASKCVADEDLIKEGSAVVPAGEVYNEAECIAEAERCIRCQCNACETYCDLIDYYEKWPVKMRDEIFLSVKPAGSLVHKCPSRKYIAACTDCKILEDTCPENIDLCGMIKVARHQMHEADKMPAAYKQYYMRDMEFANGEYASIVRQTPVREASTQAGMQAEMQAGAEMSEGAVQYAFFPGCNLGALDPDYVIKPYRWLLDQFGDVGLMLKCCSIPASWAGNTEVHDAEIKDLEAEWESLGKPVLVTACLSCDKHLHEYLPQIETVTLYELMAEAGAGFGISYDSTSEVSADGAAEDMSDGAAEAGSTVYAVFDPCSARGNEKVQDAVRKLASEADIYTEELHKKDMHGCCGFGGQGAMAQPAFTQYVMDKRLAATDKPYLVYCSNCRDVFTSQGREAVHILDVLFDINRDNRKPSPGITDRRVNRVVLKERLLKEFWGEEMMTKPDQLKYELKMNDEIAAKVERLHILADDICNVIERADRTGRRTRNPENGHYKAYNEIGAITLWVEYGIPKADAPVREIYNVYTHRMQIKLEEVFNGKKIDG